VWKVITVELHKMAHELLNTSHSGMPVQANKTGKLPNKKHKLPTIKSNK
jgi:hypothetical protein